LYHSFGFVTLYSVMPQRLAQEEFVQRATLKHKGMYDYSRVNYQGANRKVEVICKEHGSFWQLAAQNMRGRGCAKCGGTAKRTIIEFVEKANEVHGGKYNYAKSKYENDSTKLEICGVKRMT